MHAAAGRRVAILLFCGLRRPCCAEWGIQHGDGRPQTIEDDPCVLHMSVHRCDRRGVYSGGCLPPRALLYKCIMHSLKLVSLH